MKITTNITDTEFVHDKIKYLPIEKQVFDLFRDEFKKTSYEIDRDGFTFILDGTRCGLEVMKRDKGVRLSVMVPYSHDEIRFGDLSGKYPSLKLSYNIDIKKKVDKFCEQIHKIQDLEKRAKALPAVPDQKKIEAFLKKELSTKEVTVSFWLYNLFDGAEIGFNLHPKDKAPADGVYMFLEKGTNKLFPRATEQIEWAIGKPNPWGGKNDDYASWKHKIDAVERIKTKIDAFDPKKSKDLMRLINVKTLADTLVEEFQKI